MALATSTGCAGVNASVAPPARSSSSSADLGEWIVADDATPARATVLRAVAFPAVTRIASTPIEAARPRHAARIDVDFVKAEMGYAFRLLAEAGRFNLVLQEGLTAQVSGTMHRVDAYDALLALAHANGAQVSYEREVVVVTKR
jgi:hypothetical protein